MKFDKLIAILPCQSLDGYALDKQNDHAEELLSAWCALYHPAFLASAQSLPTWGSPQDPPKDPTGGLVIITPSSEPSLGAGWLDEASNSAACVLRGLRSRHEMVQAALERLDAASGAVNPELAADFLALGFCHLQLEVLTRDAGYGMGYDMQYYDEQYYDYGDPFDRELFRTRAIAAAEAAVQGDEQAARDGLQSAFSHLTDARRGLPYPYSADSDPCLLNLTLVASTTLGAALRAELTHPGPTNLLVSGHLIEQMREREPATLLALREALNDNRAILVGGEFDEDPLPLLTPEAIFRRLRRGLSAYQQHLGSRPTVFGRRRFGLSPVLPQILRQNGFAAALHFTLDDGRFPTSTRSKVWWVGLDGTEIEAIAKLPLDASQAASFLNFGSKVVTTSQQDGNAAVLAHWPGQSSPWCRDLQRAGAYSPVLGRFQAITEYFQQTQTPTERIRSGVDQYRSPYLRQAVARGQSNPISRWTEYYRRRAAADALTSLCAMADLVGGPPTVPCSDDDLLEALEQTDPTGSGGRPQGGANAWDKQCPPSELDNRLQRRLEEAASRLFALLPRDSSSGAPGYLVANPLSFPRRMLVGAPSPERVSDAKAAAGQAGGSSGAEQAVVEVPPMGFAWVAPRPCRRPSKEKARKWGLWRRRKAPAEVPMAEENVLRNDLLEVVFDPITGAIQAVRDYASGRNRLAQQIAMRLPQPKAPHKDGWGEEHLEQDYTVMRGEGLSVTSAGPAVGRIVSRGQLLTRDGRRVARFVQTTEVRRASPVLRLTIELEIQREPEPDPWSSYYAARFAWGDATADVYRSVSLTSRPTESAQLEAPHFVDVRSERERVTILTAGLPYHRRFGLRKLDTLLVVRGETARSFQLGIGIDLTHPVPAALDFLAPHHVRAEDGLPSKNPSGWLFHMDAKNVIATGWEPLLSEGRATGFRVRLLETEGRRSEVGLRSFRPAASARKVDLQGENPTELPVDGDKITVEIGGHEWVQVEAEFPK